MTVYKSKNTPYYHFDFRRGGRRYSGSTKRTTKTEAEAIEQAHIERAEREADAAVKAATAPEMIAILPRHVLREPCKAGWKYSFIVPTKAKRAGCPIRNQALGTEYESAVARAENVLLPELDAWWTDYTTASKMPDPRVKPPANQKSAKPHVGVYLLMLKGKVVYVGSSRRMPKRVADHRTNGRPFDDVFYIATDEKQRTKLEAELIKTIDPVQNKFGRAKSDAENPRKIPRLANQHMLNN